MFLGRGFLQLSFLLESWSPSHLLLSSLTRSCSGALEDGHKLPFEVLDNIIDEGIDITGLTVSNTTRGNLYRARRLMKH